MSFKKVRGDFIGQRGEGRKGRSSRNFNSEKKTGDVFDPWPAGRQRRREKEREKGRKRERERERGREKGRKMLPEKTSPRPRLRRKKKWMDE